ncbi:MAG: cytochrome P450 [Deltaproteobacteria bacterium]|nr:cytochrome P450 [Deltaproteobacteria bacterium]
MPITDGTELVSPDYYGEHGPPHDLFTQLRAESPVHLCESEDYDPFWAITRHEDICWISKHPEHFLNEPGITLRPRSDDVELDPTKGIGAMKTIIEMDPPRHREFRRVASPHFTPRVMRGLEPMVAESARNIVDGLAGTTGEGSCDFAVDVAAAHPLRIISTILGVPREQEPVILDLTNQLLASDDSELGPKGEDRQQAITELGGRLYALFDGIIQDRRANPRDDLASVLANATIGGEPLGPVETFGYYLITFTAGHDTTKNAIVGGMQAFLENPAELEKLRANLELVPSAVEEIVRWTSPVNMMKRTAARDIEVAGKKIRKGDALVLLYASANRDESVFEDPFEFRVDRNPNPHLAFGHGEHYCLGTHLARRSQRALLRELAGRLEHVETAGPADRIRSSLIVGYKHLPIRYRLASAC